ncbi:uncharacterized protein EV422DRAFT_507963 [Fimicolochytrium jonesii]|uniref:uncharacterized protein n=1 Tax=Fimicolochytrium jonesii TaxID=1396493 RepID=UPI0022FF28C7|nr:uncharacterized protein EV422DRAFT_507963 [Fimicolochytrium jonesii]KAI8818804.1 hypothetical protein EV422DRAFT_507963 [Fimicolochytrium jonesii]
MSLMSICWVPRSKKREAKAQESLHDIMSDAQLRWFQSGFQSACGSVIRRSWEKKLSPKAAKNRRTCAKRYHLQPLRTGDSSLTRLLRGLGNGMCFSVGGEGDGENRSRNGNNRATRGGLPGSRLQTRENASIHPSPGQPLMNLKNHGFTGQGIAVGKKARASNRETVFRRSVRRLTTTSMTAGSQSPRPGVTTFSANRTGCFLRLFNTGRCPGWHWETSASVMLDSPMTRHVNLIPGGNGQQEREAREGGSTLEECHGAATIPFVDLIHKRIPKTPAPTQMEGWRRERIDARIDAYQNMEARGFYVRDFSPVGSSRPETTIGPFEIRRKASGDGFGSTWNISWERMA